MELKLTGKEIGHQKRQKENNEGQDGRTLEQEN
jgi:hypothetical protein